MSFIIELKVLKIFFQFQGELQEQLKEAETLLNKTKHERNNLLVENHALKKTNTELRRQVIEAEQDTQQARVELEMIEDMVSSIDNQKGFFCILKILKNSTN